VNRIGDDGKRALKEAMLVKGLCFLDQGGHVRAFSTCTTETSLDLRQHFLAKLPAAVLALPGRILEDPRIREAVSSD